MDNKTKKIFKEYMKNRFSHVEIEDPYYKEWEKRFKKGMEWQNSDYTGRAMLKDIAYDVYPNDKDDFFIRK